MLPNNTIHAAGPACAGPAALRTEESDDRSDTDSRNHPDRPGGRVLRRRVRHRRVRPAFRRRIRGVDVASASDDQVRAIRAALVNYKVIVFRGQQLDDAAHIEFGRRLGELTFGHPVWNSGDVPAEVYSSTVPTTVSPTSGTPTSLSCNAPARLDPAPGRVAAQWR